MPVNPETANPAGVKHPHKGGKGGGKKWHPPKGVGGAVGGAGGAAAHMGGGSRHNVKKNRKKVRRIQARNVKRENRQAWREARDTNYGTISANTASKAQRDVGWKPSVKDIIGDQIEADVRTHDPGAIHPTVGAMSTAAKPLANALITVGFPEKAGAQAAGSVVGKILRGIGRGKAAERTAAKEAERTAVKEAEKVAAKREAGAAKRKVRPERKGEPKVKAKEKPHTSKSRDPYGEQLRKGKGERKLRDKTYKSEHPLPERVKTRAGKTWKARQPHALTKKGRQVMVRGAATRANQAAHIAPFAAAAGAGIAESTGSALVDDPGKTLTTTTRALTSMPGAVAGIAGDTALSAKRAITGEPNALDPLAGQWEMQKQYWEDWAKIAEGGDAGRKAIENKYGLVPAATAGLSTWAALRPFTRAPHSIEVRRAGRLQKAAEEGDAGAQRALMDAERLRDARANHQRVARTFDTAKHRRNAQAEVDLKTKGTDPRTGKSRSLRSSLHRLKKAKVGNVTGRDAVALVHSEGVPLDAVRGRARLIEIRDRVNAEAAPDTPLASKASTQEVLDALIDHPQLLEHPDMAIAGDALRQIQDDISRVRHEASVGVEKAAGAKAPADERARLLPVARHEGIATPEERVPTELRGIRNKKGGDAFVPKTYQDMKVAARSKARSWVKSAASKEAQAKVLKQGSPKRMKLERDAARLRAKADTTLAVVDRLRRAGKMETQGRRLIEDGDVARGKSLIDQAQELRREHFASEQRILDEYVRDVNKAIDEKGLRQPVFFPERSSGGTRNGEPYAGGRDFAGLHLPAREKMRSGKLREWGLVDQSGGNIAENIYRVRSNLEFGRAMRDLMDEMSLADVLSGDELRALMNEGRYPAGYSPIPTQEFARTYAAGDWTAAQGVVHSAMHEAIAGAKIHPGKKYALIPTSALKEAYGQMSSVSKLARNLRRFGVAQSWLMLATSPTWAAFQMFATPLVLLARHPNPYRWARLVKHLRSDYRKIPLRVRRDFEAIHGGVFADISDVFSTDLGMHPRMTTRMNNAAKVASETAAGRFVRGLSFGLTKPVGKYEAWLRKLDSLIELDKLHNPGAIHGFAQKVSLLEKTTREQIAHIDSLPFKDQVTYYAKHPAEARVIQERLIDALGDWTSLTKFEKEASSIAVFYPFLRFSLRWTFYSFPKNNPIKAAILLNLAQANSEEVEKMLGGAPSFFTGWGQIPLHGGEGGKITSALNLARAAPGSNALIEGFGQGEVNLASATRALQPVLGAATLALLDGRDPLTGEPLEDPNNTGSRLSAFAQQIMGLNPVTRATVVPAIQERSDMSELFRSIGDATSPIERALVPDLLNNAAQERAKAAEGRKLDRSGNAPTTDEINALVDKMVASGKPPKNIASLMKNPDFARLWRRQAGSQRAQDAISADLKAAGLGDSPEREKLFKLIYNALNYSVGAERTEKDRARYLRKTQGLTNAQIAEQYPKLDPVATRIEALRRSGMTDAEIAAKYPGLRRHLSSSSSSSSIGSSSIGSSSIGGSSIGGSSIGN